MTADADDQGQAAEAGAGTLLRRARESKGLSTAEVAARLHLDRGVVEALEADDEARLPAPIFVRGYLRSYARLLEIEEGPLLARYRPAEPASPRLPQPVRSGVSLPLPRLPWRGLLRLGLLAAVVGLGLAFGPALWERLQAPEGEGQAGGELELPLAPATPADGGEAAGPSAEATVSAGEAPLALPAVPAAPAPVVEPPPAAAPAPAAEAAPAAGTQDAVSRAAPTGLQVVVELTGDSWIEMKDAGGRRLLYGLYKEGTVKQVSGVPPLSVKLGNSGAVRLQVDGEPFDQSRYNRGNLARFEIPAPPAD